MKGKLPQGLVGAGEGELMNSISRVNNDGEEADEEDDEGIDLNKDVDDGDDDGVTLYL